MAEAQTISVFLELKDKLSGGLNQAGDALDKLPGKSRAAESGFSSMGLSGAAAIGGIATAVGGAIIAIKGLAQEGIDLNRAFENTSIRIAGTLKAFDVAPTFAKAQAQAAGVMHTIADLAAKLPGETEDYVSVFAQALPKAIAAGMTDMQKVAEFTSHWTAVATSNMVDAQQAGLDLFRVLSGQAGADVRMWTVLTEKVGMTAEAFNKLAAPERLAKIQEAIGAFDAQLIAAGDTFEAKAGEFESHLKEIKRVGSEMSFEMAKKSLDSMNERLKESQKELTTTVDLLGGAFTFYAEGIKGMLADIGIGAAKMLNTLILTPEQLAELRAGGAEVEAKPSRLEALAAAQERETRAREERIEYFKTQRFEEIERLLPPEMQRGLGATGMATPKVFDALVKLGKSQKTDVVFRNRLMDYAEYMKLDEDLLYYKITGRKSEEQAKLKTPTAKRETTTAPQTNFYNSRFDIKQQFAEGFNPDRIAVAFAQDIARVGEMKTQAGYTQTGSVR